MPTVYVVAYECYLHDPAYECFVPPAKKEPPPLVISRTHQRYTDPCYSLALDGLSQLYPGPFVTHLRPPLFEDFHGSVSQSCPSPQ